MPIAASPTNFEGQSEETDSSIFLRDAKASLETLNLAITRGGPNPTPKRLGLVRKQMGAMMEYDLAVNRFIADKSNDPAERMKYALKCFLYARKISKMQQGMIEKLKSNAVPNNMEDIEEVAGNFAEKVESKEFNMSWYADQMREICKEDSSIEGCAGLDEILNKET
ncbi:MAG: hypothetical protein M1829_001463 [Trizodia sp. TS-e1964]|nr:MAG: hypothetical protein M1829_001463 [Trizodia sp. TS-e1964]